MLLAAWLQRCGCCIRLPRRWGLLLAPPPLRLHYLRTLSALLALPPGGAIVLAAHIAAPAQPAAAGEEQQGGAAGDEHLQLAAAGSFHSMCEAEVSELAAAAAGCAGLRLARRERLPAGALLTGLGRGAASGNTLLLFERC